MDIDAGDSVKEVVYELSKICCVFSLGIRDENGVILRDFKRQSDESSCATYSLFDLEEMLKMNFFKFSNDNSKKIKENLYSLTSLPPICMSTIQSINGKTEDGIMLRNGLKHAIKKNPLLAKQRFTVNGEETSLNEILNDIETEKIVNPIIDIMNETNLSLFFQEIAISDANKLKEKYMLSILNFSDLQKQKKLSELIFNIAYQQSENNDDMIENNDDIIDSANEKNLNGSNYSRTILMGSMIVGILAFLIAIQNVQQKETLKSKYPKSKILRKIKQQENYLKAQFLRRATENDFGIKDEEQEKRLDKIKFKSFQKC